MKTSDLISKLSADVPPIKRLPRPGARFIRWFAAMVFCFAVSLALKGVREDLLERLREPLFFASLLTVLAASLVSALAAFLLSVPGEERRWTRFVPLIALWLWGVVILLQAITGASLMGGIGWGCARDVILLGALPGALLFWMVRSAAPLKLDWTGAFVMLTLGALGAFGAQLGCHDDALFHVLVWHFLPVIGVGIIGIFIGRRFLRKV